VVVPNVGDYFGGAPRFDSSNTFLGQKVLGNAIASQPATEQVNYMTLLGTSDVARYGTQEDMAARMAPGRIPIANTLQNEDQIAGARGIVGAKLQTIEQNAPANWTIPQDWIENLKQRGQYDPNDPNLWNQYVSERDAYLTGQALKGQVDPNSLPAQKLPMTGPATGLGAKVVGIANNYIGTNRYRYGVFDCSKFTQKAVLEAIGLNIGGDTASQMGFFQKQGKWTTDINYAQPGDTLYFASKGSPSGRHTGIYIGSGLMIDNAGQGIPIKVHSIAGRKLLGIGLVSRWYL
jgi:cell wall-associated NlpC family hydrolase